MYQLEFAPAANATYTITAGTTLTVNNLLSTSGSAIATFTNGNISAKGDIATSNTGTTGTGGSTVITINGSGTQTLTGSGTAGASRLPDMVINKSSSDTLKLVGYISEGGNWTYTAGIINAGTSTVYFRELSSKTITGSHSLYNVSFTAWGNTLSCTITSGTILTVNGFLQFEGTDAISLSSGAIYAKGKINAANTSTSGGGTTTITINGTGTQTLSGVSTLGEGPLSNIVINKSSSDTLYLVNDISVQGNWTYTAGIIHPGTSWLDLDGTKTITGSHTVSNVWLAGGGTYTIASGTILTINGSLGFGGTPPALNGGTIYAKGNVDLSNESGTSGGGGSTTIVINGSGTQKLIGSTTPSSGRICNINISKSSSDTLIISDNLTELGTSWTYTSGIVKAGSSSIQFASTCTISGSHKLNNVLFYGGVVRTYTISSGSTLTIGGSLTLTGTAQITLTTGTIEAQGDIIIGNTSPSTGGSTAIVINGTGNQTFTGDGVAGEGKLPKITVNKSSGTLYLNSIISIVGDWIYSGGTVAASYYSGGTLQTSNVVLYGTNNLNGTGGGATMSFYDLTIGGNTRTLTGNIKTTNNLTVNSGTTLSAGSNSVTVGGNWSDNGTWTYATSTVTFNGGGYNSIAKTSGTETFYNLAFNRSGGSHTLSNPVTVNNSMTLTKGHVKTSSTNYLTLIDNATISGGSDSAYVCGPMRKTGNDIFTFPLGDTTLNDTAYHPLAMTTAPSSTSDQFEATYFAKKYTVGDSLVDSLTSVSQVENWKLERKVGSSNVAISVGWNKNSNIGDIGSLRISGWNGTKWLDYGQASVVLNWPRGTVTSSLSVNFPANPIFITIGVSRPNYSGYATLKRKLDGGFNETKNNSLFFKFDDEYNDLNDNLTYRIIDASNIDERPNLVGNTNNFALSYYGDNRFRLDLYYYTNTTLASGYYTLELTNEKNEKFYLRFHKS